MALTRKWIASPCYHGRNTGGVRLIVIHTAEGARTIEDLGHFFANYGNQVSSHTGADDQRGVIGEYVKRGNASWTQANFNNVAVSLELCGFASWSRSAWLNQHDQMLRNCAAWIAEEAKHFGIPLTALSPSQAQGGGRGVCQHIDLGSGGGGHVDCGPGFPMDYVMDLARGGSGSSEAEANREETIMQLVFDAGDQDHAPACSLSIPNEYSRGKHKLRFSAKDSTALRVDFGAGGQDVTLGYLAAQSVNIDEGQRTCVIKRDSGTSPVSVCISER
jgi:hypothetical protein